MSPEEVEGTDLVMGVKPVRAKRSTGFLKNTKRLPSSFCFVIPFSLDLEWETGMR